MADKHTLILMTAGDTDAMLKAANPNSKGLGGWDNASFVLGSDALPGETTHDLVYRILSENGEKKDAFRPGSVYFDSLLTTPIHNDQLPALEEKFNIIRVNNAKELVETRDKLHNAARERLGLGRRDSAGITGV